eukprot:4476015-Pleurochrysis_carterae.AAC.1
MASASAAVGMQTHTGPTHPGWGRHAGQPLQVIYVLLLYVQASSGFGSLQYLRKTTTAATYSSPHALSLPLTYKNIKISTDDNNSVVVEQTFSPPSSATRSPPPSPSPESTPYEVFSG